jgi:hypothetical protein
MAMQTVAQPHSDERVCDSTISVLVVVRQDQVRGIRDEVATTIGLSIRAEVVVVPVADLSSPHVLLNVPSPSSKLGYQLLTNGPHVLLSGSAVTAKLRTAEIRKAVSPPLLTPLRRSKSIVKGPVKGRAGNAGRLPHDVRQLAEENVAIVRQQVRGCPINHTAARHHAQETEILSKCSPKQPPMQAVQLERATTILGEPEGRSIRACWQVHARQTLTRTQGG